jgi:hypothetical protein
VSDAVEAVDVLSNDLLNEVQLAQSLDGSVGDIWSCVGSGSPADKRSSPVALTGWMLNQKLGVIDGAIGSVEYISSSRAAIVIKTRLEM